MPPLKKSVRDRLNRLHGRLPSPKKAIKRVAAIALSPVKARPEKKHRRRDPDDSDKHAVLQSLPSHPTTDRIYSKSMQEPESGAANCEDNDDIFLVDTNLLQADYHTSVFHQGSTPESPTAAPMAFKLRGKLTRLHHDSNDQASIHTFPTPDAPSMLAESDDDEEIIPPEFDELCAPEAGSFLGDGYPRSAPSKSFLEKMAALGAKQILAVAPDITSASAALVDMELTLRGPSRGAGGGYKSPDLSPWVHVRMEGICSHLAMYTNPKSVTYGKWGLSVRQAAIAVGRDEYCARRFASLSREYITCRKVLPVNPYGQWKESMLADEDLASDVRDHLQELGKFITADKLVNYLSREDVMEKHGLDKKISIRTARKYLHELGYRFKVEKKGQYCDGHERDDVVYYREEVYLPTLKGFQDRSCIFEADGSVITPSLPAGVRRTVIWYHDESIFYAHDRR
ncbi:hypothetical protein C8R45DRAFT_918270 [Mycena sanguinolenta]|nr:hypothetical protein C8R45DRAFT_918270 [Mycena sanguinolenta]